MLTQRRKKLWTQSLTRLVRQLIGSESISSAREGGSEMEHAQLLANQIWSETELPARVDIARRIRRACSLAVFAVTSIMSGCATNEIKWTEEVQLSDGRVVQVKRRTELTESGFPLQTRGLSKFHELCYAPLNLYWKSKPPYRLWVFDIVDGRAVIKVPVNGCTECTVHNYPTADALYFEWIGESWKKIDENEKLRNLQFNLLDQTHILDDGKDDARGLVTLSEKRRRDGSIYESMRVTGHTGPSRPGACERCRTTSGKVQTDMTEEVQFTSERKNCDW